MRVVAGTAGGRPLVSPEGTNTRPTSDRVRESIFNMLFSLDATEDANVCDLYAGSGALGIEALSRGAKHCTFVEQDRRAIETIETNLDILGFSDQALVVQADVLAWLARREGEFGRFDLVLADPPYNAEEWVTVLDLVNATFLVAESNNRIEPHPLWDVVRDKKYGATLVNVLTPKEPSQ